MAKALGKLVDELYEARAERLKLEKEIKIMKAKESRIKGQIMERLNKSDAGVIGGNVAIATISNPVVPTLVDWDAFWNFTRRKSNMDLLSHRVATEAWRARYESKIVVPGTEAFRTTVLNLRKRGGRKSI